MTIDARAEDVLAGGDDPEVDLVLISYLQLPADERARALRRGAAALAPGGTFLLVAHDLRNHGEGYGGPRDAGLLWTVEEVVEGLGPSFEVIAARIEERPVDGRATTRARHAGQGAEASVTSAGKRSSAQAASSGRRR